MKRLITVGGFLGAGKTSFIKQVLKEARDREDKKRLILENDFGEMNLDEMLLEQEGYRVESLTSGCICCSISQDYKQILPDLVEDFSPEEIWIEPSGVASLTDLRKQTDALAGLEDYEKVYLTLVDASRMRAYAINLPDFFEDQILRADHLILTHSEGSGWKDFLKEKDIDPRSVLLWSQPEEAVLDRLESLLQGGKGKSSSDKEKEKVTREEGTGSHSEHSCDHDHGTCQGHSHSEQKAQGQEKKSVLKEQRDGFQSYHYEPQERTQADWNDRISSWFERYDLYRVKGILKTEKGYRILQAIPGSVQWSDWDGEGNELTLIGRHLEGLLEELEDGR